MKGCGLAGKHYARGILIPSRGLDRSTTGYRGRFLIHFDGGKIAKAEKGEIFEG